MARDGSGVYSLPAGTSATSGTTIESAKYNQLTTDLETDANTARPVVAGGTGATSAGGARDSLEIDAKVQNKSAAYTAVAGDRSTLIRGTAAYTLSLTAAATLGDGWFIDVLAETGTTTIDPDGAETIDGSATLAVSAGSSVRIRCDGTSFYSQFHTVSSGIADVVDDTTPQLGGTLDTNSKQVRWSKGADVASATTLTLGDDGNYFDITGTTTIAGIATKAVGTVVMLHFDSALTLTHSSALQLPGDRDIATVAGDHAVFAEYSAGNWRCVSFTSKSGELAGQAWAAGDVAYHNGTNFVRLAKGTASQVLAMNSGATAPEWAASSSGLTKIATIDLASDATADFTGFDATKYDAYEFVLQNVIPANDAVNLVLRTSTDGGTTFDSGASDYAYALKVHTSAPAASDGGSASATYIILNSGGMGSAAGEDGWSGVVRVLGPHLAKQTQVVFSGFCEDSAGAYQFATGGGVRISPADVDAVRFMFGAGNLESGTITMYGVAN